MAQVYSQTLPQLLRSRAEQDPHRIAMRRKKFGIWNTYTYREYYDQVRSFGAGLIALGLNRNDTVCIIGDNDPEWYWAELGSQAAGGRVVGIFTDCSPEEVQYYIDHSDASFVIANDQEQVDKILTIVDKVPRIKKVIYWEKKGLWFYEHPKLMSFEDVINLGREEIKRFPKLIDERIDQGNYDDIAVICYTSGTTGKPKGAMISYRNVIETCKAWNEVDPRLSSDQYVSFIPPAWIAEQNLGIASSLLFGFTVNFPEEPETVQENIREIGPQFVMYSGRQWESVYATIQARMHDAKGIKKLAFVISMRIGERVIRKKLKEERPTLLERLLYLLAYQLCYRGLLDKIGLSNIRFAYSAGSALSPEIITFFWTLGVNLKQFYGSTEGGLISIHRNDNVRPESVGEVAPGSKIRISEEGEILVQGIGVFQGYYKDPEATDKVLKDGWYHSGDGGYLTEEGHLIYIDRISDFRKLSRGRRFSPNYIEVRLRFSRYIQECMAIGGPERDYVVCLISMDFQNVGRWAEKNGVAYTTFLDLSQKDQVAELIRREIQYVNQTLPDDFQVKRFVILHKELDPDEAELTRTRKLRRSYVEQRYKTLIDYIYKDQSRVPIETEVKYQDGRVGKMQIELRVRSVDGV
jgi:long-chain acyl-CoA synthetase